MCFRVNGQMELPLGTTPFFAVFFDFPLAFTKDLQPGGINYQMRDFTPGGRFETDTDRFCALADTVVRDTCFHSLYMLGYTFLTLSHVVTDLRSIERHTISCWIMYMTLRLQNRPE